MQPGDLSWSIVRPHWERVSIYDGPEIFLTEYQETPEIPRHLLCATWCQSEVCNGGFHQFFHNPTGVLAPEASIAFAVMGLPGLAYVVAKAMAFFGDPFPRDQEDRIRALYAWSAANSKNRDPFSQLDAGFYRFLDHEGGGWEVAADRFAQRRLTRPRS